MLNTLVHSNAFKGALSGLVSAAAVDIHAFLKFKDGNEFVHYRWGIALIRWSQGIITGALMGAGYGSLIG